MRSSTKWMVATAAATTAAAFVLSWIVPGAVPRSAIGLPVGCSAGFRFALGTDRDGAPFVLALGQAASASMLAATAGTAAVLFGALCLGGIQGRSRSPGAALLLQAGMFAVMALPDIVLLLTVREALPRGAAPALATSVILLVLAALWTPSPAKLIANRVRSLGASEFVGASRDYGASGLRIFRKELLPHLLGDAAWIVAVNLPRFLHVELALVYLGLEYRFKGLGALLKSSWEHRLTPDPYLLQLVSTAGVVVWLSILPHLIWICLWGGAGGERADARREEVLP